jgi:hypothetical protein
MRQLISRIAFAFAAVVATAGSVRADEVCGCDCQNMCPLAKQANECRSTGGEALAASKVVRQDTIKFVLKNLASV